MCTEPQKLNAAYHQCLDCCAFPHPLRSMSIYLECLRHDPDWTAEEVERLENAALSILAKLAGGAMNDLADEKPTRRVTEQSTQAV